MNISIYVIMIVANILYTLVLLTGLGAAAWTHRRNAKRYKQAVESLVDELKQVIIEEETTVMTLDKGNNKSIRSSEGVKSSLINEFMKEELNAPTLTDLITRTATDEEYEEVASLLVRLARRAYEEYKFLIYKTTDELDMPHLLQIVSNWAEAPNLHKEIFKKAIDYGINMDKLRMLFAEKVRTGKVLDLGEGAVVVVDDNTGNPTTGVSNINSGLEGGEITFIVSFISKDNFKAWYDKHFPAKEEVKENE